MRDIHYSDRQAIAADKKVKERNYWLDKLSGNPVKSVFPRDREKTGENRRQVDVETFTLSEGLSSTLMKVSGENHHTLHMILAAALAVLLNKYTGGSDILVGMPIYKQEVKADFINTLLALRNQIEEQSTFKELLLQVRQTVIEAVENRNYPMEILAEDLNIQGADDEFPLFDIALLLENIQDKKYLAAIKINMTFSFRCTSTCIEGNVAYNSCLYRQSTIEQIIGHFNYLLRKTLANVEMKVRDIDILMEEEKRRIIFDFNAAGVNYPKDKTIHGLFEEQVERTPDHTALMGPKLGGNISITYGELNERAKRLAYLLIDQGVRHDVIVGIMVERSVEMIIGILGILKAGGAYLPIDPTTPGERIKYMLEDGKVKYLVNKSNNFGFSQEEQKERGLFVLDFEHLDWEFVSNFDFRISDLNSANLCCIIYTSGSTGKPKGVMVRHFSVINRLNWMQRSYPLGSNDIILQKTPTTFDVSVWELFWWAITGASVCLLEPGAEKEPEKLAAAIEKNKITTIHFVPSMLNAFLDYISRADDLKKLTSLKQVFASGEALGVHQVETFNRLFKPGSTAQLINLYGPTEATVDVSYFNCTPGGDYGAIPIGKPIDNIQLYIIDKKGGWQPRGIAGELCISGVGLARGYLNRPELTSEKFDQDLWDYQDEEKNNKKFLRGGPGGAVFSKSAPPGRRRQRIYKTGDLARWLPDGNIEFLGRRDHQVKIRGFRIELGEIESHLVKHKQIKEAVVLALEPARGSKYLCAYFVAPQPVPAEKLREYLSVQLPGYMIPAFFVRMDRMPLLPNGKIHRTGFPKPVGLGEADTFVPAAAPREKAMVEIWKEVLEVPRVGIHDNFFRLGGDSIRAIRVVSRARAGKLDFTSRELFQYPTIKGLLENIELTAAPGSSPQRRPFGLISPGERSKIPVGVEDAYPLTMLQAGLIFHSELAPGTPLYHDITSYRLQGRFHGQAFEEALRHLIKRHSILRTTYDLHNFRQHMQLVHREFPLPLQVEDLRGIPGERQEEILAASLETEKSWRFDWSQPGLIRFIIHIISDETFQYTLSIHDSTLDGWSVSSLNTELFRTYFALANDQGSPGEALLKASYRDFAALEQEALTSEAHKNYWNELLTDSTFIELPRWPTGYSTHDAIEVHFHEVDIPGQLSGGLKELAKSLPAPLKSVLLAAHMRVLSVFSGNTDILTGIEHNGRPEIEDGEKILGLFLNTLPFRLKLPGGTWADLVKAAYKAEMELLPYRNYPMARMKQEQGGQPLFETVFNYTNFYVLKGLQEIDNIRVLGMDGVLETEFPFRAEFSKGAFSDEVTLALHFNKYVFSPGQIKTIGDYYARVLKAMVQNPMSRYESHSFFTGKEQREFLEKMNNTRSDYPDRRCFPQLFAARAARTPDAAAVAWKGEQLSYRALDLESNRLAAALVKRGIGPENNVAVVMERSIPLLTAILAIFKAGGVYLPMEPNYPGERMENILGQSGCHLVLTVKDYLSPLTGALVNRSWAKNRQVLPLELLFKDEAAEVPAVPRCTPRHMAYVIYTSGSTGVPKGAMIEHQGMLNHLYAKLSHLQLTHEDIIAQNASQCFDISIWQFLAALLVGGTTVIYPNDLIMEPVLWMARLVKDRVTILEVVPSYLSIMLDALDLNPTEFTLPRFLLVTGEVLKPGLASRWFEKYPGIQMVNAYGPTEASDDITHFMMDKTPGRERVPIGKPLQNLNIYIVDQYMQLCPLGVKGEICVSGVGVGRGYLNDIRQTEAAFTADPFSKETGLRLYKTGDLGCWLPDGNIDFFGRKDDQVKIRGFRIQLGEIETRLIGHPQVKKAVVLDREDEKGNKYLCAYLVLAAANREQNNGNMETGDAGAFELQHLKEYLARGLPDYMIPAHLVELEALPLTANGKLDRKALPPPGRDIVPGADGLKYAPPANQWEEKLVKIWSRVLEIPGNRIGVHHRFFDLGGNSIMLMSLANLINKHFSKPIRIVDFFRMTTVRQLAEYLASNRENEKETEIEEFEL